MLDRQIEQHWSIVKESYPEAVVFHEAAGLYVVRGGDTGVLEKEFGIEPGSHWYAFDDGQASVYMQQLVERGYSVVRATDGGAALVRAPREHRKELIKQRARGRFRLVNPSLIFETKEIERATGDAWMKRHGYEALFEGFRSSLPSEDWRSIRSYGEVYVYQVADWYEVDHELTSMLDSHVLLLAKAALVTATLLPCKLVEPRCRRNRSARNGTRTGPTEPSPTRLGQMRFELS
jgi:hypothetical protein